LKKRFLSTNGQSLVEFALMLPLMLVIALGVTEVGYALFDQHVVTKLSREGSNMISRDASLQDAETVLRNMSTRPVNFTNGSSKAIFSVLLKVAATGTTNYNQTILYARRQVGSYSCGTCSSVLQSSGGSFGGPPDYQAANTNSDASLRITNLPPNVTMSTGGMLYVTEIWSRHDLITPFDRFGITLPQTLYSIAFF
jgi:hypothetical protein